MKNKQMYVLYVLIAFMAVFTFTDLSISQLLYKPGTLYGALFKVLGELPYFMVGLFSTSYLLITSSSENVLFRLLKKILLLFLLTRVSIHFAINIRHYMNLEFSDFWLIVLINVIIFLSFLVGLWISKRVAIETFTKLALCGLIMCLASYILINLLKNTFGRMRFREFKDMADYTRWYVINSSALNDGFKSFPSGHTSGASLILWFTLLPNALNLKVKSYVCHLIAWIWILLTMFSRVVEGAHFVTDTTMSIIIIYITFMISTHVLGLNKENSSKHNYEFNERKVGNV
ncbi:phosphatase PAP2 family protein [Acidaminobacter sp. JC074]|uniref:phosphatase PAP2 family protein n=1 Tax=Acidaminobacter sp. JC074 TaxID=2530199 RepID=UPI001F0DF025|nr:phosphatase PAP2 family protein [Acidaminobacter sp. JC074]